MLINFTPFTVTKKVALTISRGTSAQNTNLWIKISSDDIEGWGESVHFSIGEETQTTEKIITDLNRIIPLLTKFEPWQLQEIEEVIKQEDIVSSVKAGIDIALNDWLGKKLGYPLGKIWGLNSDRIPPTSLTIGISSPSRAKQRVKEWAEITDINFLKIKLGNPEGILADQAMLKAVLETAPNTIFSVDANGGWNLKDALIMCEYLAQLGVKYIEQPLPKGTEDQLIELYERSPIPIIADESCFNSQDIIKLADKVHGINIKLMKCGGLTEAKRMIDLAKTCNLKVMLGCYSDSILSNSA
ncbi:MAG TPA: dipeptide epimerase, partial [Allocoleopsis sp.]